MPSRDPVRMLRCNRDNKNLLLPNELFNDIMEDQDDLNTRYLKLSGSKLSDDDKEIKVGYSKQTDKLLRSRSIGLVGVDSTPQEFDGTQNVYIPITGIPSSLITGTISIDNLPSGALERVYPVENDDHRFSLTTIDVQNGDIVKVKTTGLMYLVKDDTKLNSEDGYEIYKAGWAAAVPWSGVTEKPISHSLEDADPTHFPSSKVVNELYQYTINSMNTLETRISDIISENTSNVQTAISDLRTDLSNKIDNDITNLVNNTKVNTAKEADVAVKLKNARKIDGVNFDGTADIIHYGSCTTDAATAAKIVALTDFTLVEGSRIAVKFTNSNTNTSPTLNVNNTGAINIVKYGTTFVDPNSWNAGAVVEFIYDGVSWCMTSSSGSVYHVGSSAPTNKSILWIDTDTTTGGLKYWNGSAWKHVPVAYT